MLFRTIFVTLRKELYRKMAIKDRIKRFGARPQTSDGECNRHAWKPYLYFLLLSVTVLLKAVLFQYTTFHSIPLGSIITNPQSFFAFWLPKLAIALFIGSFAFVFTKRWWSVVVVIIGDLWIISNAIYYSANSLLLNAGAILIANNLHGFESSVLMYITSAVWLQLALTAAYCAMLYTLVKPQDCARMPWHFATGLLAGIVFSLLGGYSLCSMYNQTGYIAMYQERHNPRTELVIPFYGDSFDAGLFPTDYVRNHSIYMYLPMVASQIFDVLTKDDNTEVLTAFTADEVDFLSNNMPNDSVLRPKSSCVLILVESLEDWAIHMKDDDGNEVAPNFLRLLKSDNTAYFSKIKSQIQHGVSGDGQLIINTGLLPTENEIACMNYGGNTYPNFASHYDFSYIVNPSPDTWNQSEVTFSYGYKSLIEPQSGMWEDDSVFNSIINIVDTTQAPFMLQALTINTHTPFNRAKNGLNFSKGTPVPLVKYLNCLHYTDSCFGLLYDHLLTTGMLDSITLVVTGDHTIFKRSLLHEFYPYVTGQSIEFYEDRTYSPLIIRSQQINGAIVDADEHQQMDIFPTILSVLGLDEYYWHGFGAPLIGDAPCEGTDSAFASQLSEKLIKSNWFSNPVLKVSPEYGQHYIAHGGGRINGHNYSNSREAVMQSIKNGISFIELDLALTADNKLAFLHDWYGFNWMTTGTPVDFALTYNDYCSAKIFESLTPITTEWLLNIMAENPCLWIVTDKISDAGIIDKYFHEVKGRVIVECFAEEDYLALESKGYTVMRSLWPPNKFMRVKYDLISLFGGHDKYPYNHYVCGTDANLTADQFDWVALYSVDTRAQADSIFATNPKIHLIYVNDTER